ncbi:MAG: transketolase [Acidobacteria bacterium]|nr:transketolase [Acidobacteriota bacterium]MBI3663703.1 transketolase [Acidobacteriota bacterium]
MTSTREERGPRRSLDELQRAAAEMRAIDLVDIFAAGSGHPGGTLSIMDLAAALYLRVLNHDPADPNWPERDRVYWSAGHKAPALYVALGKAGYYPLEDTVLLRQLGSGFEGHPNRLKVPGVEVSSGSLGQGLGIAVGNALAAKLLGKAYRVYCILGDGEQQEGSIWEAAMAGGHYQLDNLCGIIDQNQLQIDGRVKEVMNVEPLAAKYAAFGWNVIELDGHNMEQIVEGFEKAAAAKGKPTVLIARTVKGKGVSFMENEAGWHGVAPNKEQFEKAIPELLTADVPRARVDVLVARAAENAKKVAKDTKAAIPSFQQDRWWNALPNMKVEMDPTRMGFGRGLESAGEDPRVVTIHADISSSIRITDFEAKHPERMNRVFSVGIAEQNMMSVAAGLSKEGLIPVTGTYGVFASGRAWDQIRTTICYSNLNVKIAGAHGGISVGPDGATHQSLEEISLMSILPNMHVYVPCDSLETEKATKHALLELVGPAYVRFAREATPIVTKKETPYQFGAANVIRYRGEQAKFIDAFETVLASEYTGENEDAAIVACGPMVPEAMRAAWILKEDLGIEVRVVNVHTVKPLDVAALLQAAAETQCIVTAEEHQVGGFGNIIAGAILKHRGAHEHPLLFDMIGVRDRFGVSGKPWELVQHFGLTAEHIAERVKRLVESRGLGTAAEGTHVHTSILAAVECSRCHALVPFGEFMCETPLAGDELCADCERRSEETCAECRTEWTLTNPNFNYLCRDCRDISVPC